MRTSSYVFCISLLWLGCGTENAAPPQEGPRREVIILDTDTTAFDWLTWDLEDDIAVLFALADDQLEIKGLTITFGNGTQCGRFDSVPRHQQHQGVTSYAVIPFCFLGKPDFQPSASRA